MKNKAIVISSVMVLLILVVIVADYAGLFGTRQSTRLDFAEARFKTVDAETGAPVFGSRVKCQQRGNSNACTLKDSKSTDVLTLLFPRQTLVTKTRLFTRDEKMVLPEYPNVYIFFVNPGYHTINVTMPIMDILDGTMKMKTVRMKPRQ